MLHLEFMIAESSTIKARALSITSMSLFSTGQTTHDEVVDPNSSVPQSYVPTSSVAHPCP